jgi:hypothetical protein
MDIKLKIVKENKDGSANAMVDFDKEGLEFLVQEGVLSLINQAIAHDKNAQDGIKLRKKMEKKNDNVHNAGQTRSKDTGIRSASGSIKARTKRKV